MWLKTKYIWEYPAKKQLLGRDSCFFDIYYTFIDLFNQLIYNCYLNRFQKLWK